MPQSVTARFTPPPVNTMPNHGTAPDKAGEKRVNSEPSAVPDVVIYMPFTFAEVVPKPSVQVTRYLVPRYVGIGKNFCLVAVLPITNLEPIVAPVFVTRMPYASQIGPLNAVCSINVTR